MLLSIADFNAGQVDAIYAMQEFFADDERTFFGLFGYAGTGKSTVLSYLGHTAEAHERTIVMCAPTHKAVSVLKNMRDPRSALRNFETIHRMLSIKGQDNMETGDLEFKVTSAISRMPICAFNTLIVDECSMLNEEMVSLIKRVCEEVPLKVVFVGDPFQLPPVKEEDRNGGRSHSFNVPHRAILKAVERSYGPVAECAHRARRAIGKDVQIEIPRTEVTDRVRSETRVLDMFMEKPETGQILTYMNKDVLKWNTRVRQRIHGNSKNLPHFLPGDRLVAAQGTPTVNASQEFTVRHARQIRFHNVPCYILEVEGYDLPIYAYTPAQKNKVIEHQSKLKGVWQKAKKKGLPTGELWRNFVEFRDAFVDLRHGYAQTIHKSQGSTYERVFVEEGELFDRFWKGDDIKYRGKLLYVAYSRAAEQLYVL